MPKITWSEIIATAVLSLVITLAGFGIIWLLFVLGVVPLSKIYGFPNGFGTFLLILGMLFTSIIYMLVQRYYLQQGVIEIPMSEGQKAYEEYDRGKLAIKVGVIALLVNIMGWVIAAYIQVGPTGDPLQNFAAFPAIFITFVFNVFNNVSYFWVTQAITYSITCVFLLKWYTRKVIQSHAAKPGQPRGRKSLLPSKKKGGR